MDGLCDGGLHEIDIAHNLRRKSVPQVLMELSVFQIVCKDNDNQVLMELSIFKLSAKSGVDGTFQFSRISG